MSSQFSSQQGCLGRFCLLPLTVTAELYPVSFADTAQALSQLHSLGHRTVTKIELIFSGFVLIHYVHVCELVVKYGSGYRYIAT